MKASVSLKKALPRDQCYETLLPWLNVANRSVNCGENERRIIVAYLIFTGPIWTNYFITKTARNERARECLPTGMQVETKMAHTGSLNG